MSRTNWLFAAGVVLLAACSGVVSSLDGGAGGGAAAGGGGTSSGGGGAVGGGGTAAGGGVTGGGGAGGGSACGAGDDAGITAAFEDGGGRLPAWRRAMTELNTLYVVSAGPPSQANGAITFPTTPVPYGFGEPGDPGWDVMSGYSSGTLLEELGAFGTMVYGTGGHTRLQNQLLSLPLSDDAPSFGWFQQPYYETADVNGAELYWSPTEFAALPADHKTGEGYDTEQRMTAAWHDAGAPFPMGYEGWIFPRKLVTGQLGNNHPHGFRYMAPSYLPPSMTGLDAGVFLVVEAPQGPFAQSWMPEGGDAADLLDPSARWASGGRKWPIWYKNVRTGEWGKLGVLQPDYAPYGFVRQHTAVARDQRRVYVSVDVGNKTASIWYLDFSGGLKGATVSDVNTPAVSIDPNRNTTGAFTDGHPAGKHLWYWPDLHDPAGLVVQDLDAQTQFKLHLGQGLSIDLQETVGMQYDAAHHRIVVLQNLACGLGYRVISIPPDATQADGYVVSPVRLLAVGPSVPTPVVPNHFYGKARLHAGLGVVFISQDRGPMLAFRPSL